MAPRVRPVELRRTHPDRCCSQWPLAMPHQSPIPTSARKIPHPTKLRRALIGAPPAVTLVETAIVPPAQARIIGKGTGPHGPVPRSIDRLSLLRWRAHILRVAEERPLTAFFLVQVHRAVGREQLPVGLPAVGLRQADVALEAPDEVRDAGPVRLPR